MFNIGSGEIALIAVAALLLLGPKGLPELARGLGKFMREFRRQTDEVRGVVEREFYKMDQELSVHEAVDAPLSKPAASPTPALLQPNVEALPVALPASQVLAGAPSGTPVALAPATTEPASAAADPAPASAPAAVTDASDPRGTT